MKNISSSSFIKTTVTWLAILFPFLIAAGKGPAEVGTIILSVFFIAHVVITKDFRFLKEKWVIIAGALWFYLIARSFFTLDIKHALAKSFPFIRFILLAVCLEFLVSKDQKTNSRIFIALCIALAFLVLDGFVQFFIGNDLFGRPKAGLRLTGPFSKQILGTTIASLGIISIAGIIPLLKKSKNYLLLIFLSGVLIFSIVFLSGERAALLRLIISIALLWLGLFLKAKDTQTKKNLWLIVLLSFIVCFLFLQVLSFLKPAIMDRQVSSPIREVANSQSSAYLFLWKTGLKAGLSNILFGIGPNQFEFFCKTNPNPILQICTEPNRMYFHPHNIWIEIFAESGLIGVGLLLALLYALGKKLIKFCMTRSNIFECSLVLGVGLAAFQRLFLLPSSGFFKNWYAIPIWFAIGWMLYIIRTKKIKS